jgi:hypothetical protein
MNAYAPAASVSGFKQRAPHLAALDHKKSRIGLTIDATGIAADLRDLAHLNTEPDEIFKTSAMSRLQGRSRRLQIQSQRTICRASVYPMPGPFLNPVALSNIETYPMTCGRSGQAWHHACSLRSISGTLVTMQPSMKSAQSQLVCLQPAGTQVRAAQ